MQIKTLFLLGSTFLTLYNFFHLNDSISPAIQPEMQSSNQQTVYHQHQNIPSYPSNISASGNETLFSNNAVYVSMIAFCGMIIVTVAIVGCVCYCNSSNPHSEALTIITENTSKMLAKSIQKSIDLNTEGQVVICEKIASKSVEIMSDNASLNQKLFDKLTQILNPGRKVSVNESVKFGE